MTHAIDLNRGVMIKKHPSEMLVYMYMDAPGVYLNAFGKEVPDKVAAAADYDVKTLGKQKELRKRMREAMTAIEVELELANVGGEEKIHAARGGYRIVALGLGNARIFDDDDNEMTAIPIPVLEAEILLEHLAPLKDNPPVEEEEGKRGYTPSKV